MIAWQLEVTSQGSAGIVVLFEYGVSISGVKTLDLSTCQWRCVCIIALFKVLHEVFEDLLCRVKIHDSVSLSGSGNSRFLKALLLKNLPHIHVFVGRWLLLRQFFF